jgi:predicted transcriptional regulator
VLTKLAPREQEVATIVYLNTSITAKEVQFALSSEISNAAVRSMLNRLVAKGVIRRRKGGGKFFYSPSLILADIQKRAIECLVEDFFSGSMVDASRCLLGLVKTSNPRDFADLSRLLAAAPNVTSMSETAIGW